MRGNHSLIASLGAVLAVRLPPVPQDWDRFRFQTARRAVELMNSKFIEAFAVCAFVIGAAAVTHAQQNGSADRSPDVGKYEYDTHCAECHGLSGKGDGPYVQLLRSGIVLPDLTELSKKKQRRISRGVRS